MFRGILIAIFVCTLGISASFRWKARQGGGAISRGQEGPLFVALRLVFGLPLFLGVLAYLIHPPSMAWASVPLPAWLRWVGVAVGVGVVPLAYWVFRSLGRNVSETVLTKDAHRLVTTGPYRWVRHPLYAVGTMLFVAASLIAANVFIGGMIVLVAALIRFVVIPREEANLIETFGDAYRAYQRDTGRMLPRLRFLTAR